MQEELLAGAGKSGKCSQEERTLLIYGDGNYVEKNSAINFFFKFFKPDISDLLICADSSIDSKKNIFYSSSCVTCHLSPLTCHLSPVTCLALPTLMLKALGDMKVKRKKTFEKNPAYRRQQISRRVRILAPML